MLDETKKKANIYAFEWKYEVEKPIVNKQNEKVVLPSMNQDAASESQSNLGEMFASQHALKVGEKISSSSYQNDFMAKKVLSRK
jgi:hypothetical protein